MDDKKTEIINYENKAKINSALEQIRVLDRFTLKLIAVVSMLIDHIGTIFFEDTAWLRCVGRLAMPIFCFFVAEGYFHTHDRIKYLLRMGAFALISEIPFDLAFYESPLYLGHQNVMFTFFLAIASMLVYDELTSRIDGQMGKIVGVALVLLLALASIFLKTDYNAFGIALVFLFYAFRGRGLLVQNAVGLMYQMFTRGEGDQAWAMVSAVPLMMYNGKKGRSLKWFFYCFYPGHLLVLWAINSFVI